jgi:hypothetical protein
MSYAIQTRKKHGSFEQSATISEGDGEDKSAQFWYDQVKLEPHGIVEKRIIRFTVEREEFLNA